MSFFSCNLLLLLLLSLQVFKRKNAPRDRDTDSTTSCGAPPRALLKIAASDAGLDSSNLTPDFMTAAPAGNVATTMASAAASGVTPGFFRFFCLKFKERRGSIEEENVSEFRKKSEIEGEDDKNLKEAAKR